MRKAFFNLMSGLSGGGLQLALSGNRMALTRSASMWHDQAELIGETSWAQEQLQAQLLGLLQHPSCRYLPLSICLGHGLGRLFVVTPPPHVTKRAVLTACAAMRFQTLFGKNSAAWQIEAAWDTDCPFLACAYPVRLLNTLHCCAKKSQTPLISITPYFVAAWNNWPQRPGISSWFGVQDAQELMLGILSVADPHQLIGLRSLSIPAHGQAYEWIAAQLRSVALQHQLDVPEKLYLVGNYQQYWRQTDKSLAEQRIINVTGAVNRSMSESASLHLLANTSRGLVQ